MTDRHRMADYDIAFISEQIVYVDLWSNETAIIATRFYCLETIWETGPHPKLAFDFRWRRPRTTQRLPILHLQAI